MRVQREQSHDTLLMCQRNKYDSPTHGWIHLRAGQCGKTRFNIHFGWIGKKRMFQILISRFFDSWCLFILSQFLWQQMTPAKNKQIHRYRHMCTQRSLIYSHAYNRNVRPKHFHTYRQPKWSSLLISSLVTCIDFLGFFRSMLKSVALVVCPIPNWYYVWWASLLAIWCVSLGEYVVLSVFLLIFGVLLHRTQWVYSECAEGAIIRI